MTATQTQTTPPAHAATNPATVAAKMALAKATQSAQSNERWESSSNRADYAILDGLLAATHALWAIEAAVRENTDAMCNLVTEGIVVFN